MWQTLKTSSAAGEHIVAAFIPATPTTLQQNQSPIVNYEIVVEQPPPDAIFSIIFGWLADSYC
jgi:hypothetical protein